jgi:CPA2 family monovalent cation:H+ antiporter-2
MVGHGRVGKAVSAALRARGIELIVIEDDFDEVTRLHQEGVNAVAGNAAAPEMLESAHIKDASGLLVAIPDAFEGGQIVAKARALNPQLTIIARAHSDEEVAHLKHNGASVVIMGEDEIAKAMVAQLGVTRSHDDSPPRTDEAATDEGASAEGAVCPSVAPAR